MTDKVTSRARDLAASAQRWADMAESRANIAYDDGDLTGVPAVLVAAAVSLTYTAASIAYMFTHD